MFPTKSSSLFTLQCVSLWLFSSSAIPEVRATGTTPLVRTYSGSTFFDRWSYYGNYDNTTEGDAIFVNKSLATSTPQLTYLNTAGNAIIKVDNTSTVAYNNKRDTVRIQSTDSYDVGSVWVLDAVHLPYGCSVWPAFWSYGTGKTWPQGGEIDVIEGVNNQVSNQMALHTESGCSITSSTTSYSGIVNDTSCYYENNDNSGCAVTVSDSKSYGSAFASNGGGVFVTELATTGISIWFFERANIPTAISSANSSIDTRSLGTPSGFWSSSGCSISSMFSAQSLIFDITLCGSWAGQSTILASTGCPALTGSATCYSTYVMNSSNYNTAYFEIKSLKVYSNGTTTTTSTSTSSGIASKSSIALGFGGSWLVILGCLVVVLGAFEFF